MYDTPLIGLLIVPGVGTRVMIKHHGPSPNSVKSDELESRGVSWLTNVFSHLPQFITPWCARESDSACIYISTVGSFANIFR